MKLNLFIALITVFCFNAFGQSSPHTFEVEKTGKGNSAIIFIPGFACSGEVWLETKSSFEKNYTCYTLTMAGFAGVRPTENATFEAWKDSIANYIITKEIITPIIVGHSMGGVLALAIAADYPDLIDKIVVVDALPCLAAIMNPTFKSVENVDCAETVYQMTAMTDEAFYQMQKMNIPRLLENTTMQEKVVNWSVQSDRNTFAKMYCDFSNTDLREKIKFIKCPSLILINSKYLALEQSISKQYKNLETANIKYANKGLHFIMYDDSEWYIEQLDNFIK